MAGPSHIIAMLGALGPGAALACSPVPFQVSHAPETGEDCAIHWNLAEYRTVGLGPARDMGDGIVLQDIYDGNACYWEADLLVYDCAAGRAAVIGPDQRALMDEPKETGIDRIAARLVRPAAPGGSKSLDAALAAARAEGYGEPPTLKPGQRLVVNGWPVPTDCVCRRFYPDIAGRITK